MNTRPHRIINWCVVSLLLAALMNLSIVAAAPTSKTTPLHLSTTSPTKSPATDEEQPKAKGIDPDGVRFVLRSDGTKARYIQVNPTVVEIQLSKNGINNGNAEFRFFAGGRFSAKYTPSKGKIFSALTQVSAPVSKNAKASARLILEYGKDKIVLEGDDQLPSKGVPVKTAKRLESLSQNLRNDTNLTSLFSSIRFFANKSSLEFAMPFVGDSCPWAAASCVASLVEYGLGWALIIEVCGVTVGVGCLLALLWHPVAGALVAKHCADALETCGLVS